MALEVGQLAPDFALFNTDKTKISLMDYRGKNVVILFFPFAFTGVCTAELCSMRDSMSIYEKLNAAIIGISVDSLFTLKRYKEDNMFDFDLLSDFNKEVIRLYDCYSETFAFDMLGVAKRSAFVVDKDGILQYIEILESPGDLPNFEAIQTCLNQLQ